MAQRKLPGDHNLDLPAIVGEGPAINLFRRGNKHRAQGALDLARAKRLRKLIAPDKPLDAAGWDAFQREVQLLELIGRLHAAQRAALVVRCTKLAEEDRQRAVDLIEAVQQGVDAELAHLRGAPDAAEEFLRMNPWNDDELREWIKHALDERAGE